MGTKTTFMLSLFMAAAMVCATAASQDQSAGVITLKHAAMGTLFTFSVCPPSPEMLSEEVNHLVEPAAEAIDALEKKISTWIPESQISKVNLHASEAPVKVSADVISLLQACQTFYTDSQGAFDVTIGPLLDLWGFYRKQGHLPKDNEMKEALGKVGFDKVELNETEETVHFAKAGMRVDFGGIGKGLALDRAVEVLRAQGIKNALLDAGTSTVYALGAAPGAAGWKVRIRSPYNKDEYLDEVMIRNESLSTSSRSESYVELDGKKYGHIFDPRTGWPVEGMLSTTAIAPMGMESDALSTAFFVMGLENIKKYCQAHPQVRALVVVSEDGVLKPVRINFPAK